MRGPGRTSTSTSSGEKTHMRCSRKARSWFQPGRATSSRTLRAPTMIRSGSARTTSSGLMRGNGPNSGPMMLARPSRASISPMNDCGPAAWGPPAASKYTRWPRRLGGTDCAAASTPASRLRSTRSAVSSCSAVASRVVTWRTWAEVRGSICSTRRPRPRSRSAARLDTEISTRSGLRATTASTFGSSPPPTCGSFLTMAGQLE